MTSEYWTTLRVELAKAALALLARHYNTKNSLDLADSACKVANCMVETLKEMSKADASDCFDPGASKVKMTTRRELLEVVKQMIAFLGTYEGPARESALDLKRKLSNWHANLFLILPEDKARHWRDVGNILYQHLGDPDFKATPWAESIANIWSGNAE